MYTLPHNQENFSLTETITENHNESKCRALEPNPKRYIYKIIPEPNSGIIVEDKVYVERLQLEKQELAVIFCVLGHTYKVSPT